MNDSLAQWLEYLRKKHKTWIYIKVSYSAEIRNWSWLLCAIDLWQNDWKVFSNSLQFVIVLRPICCFTVVYTCSSEVNMLFHNKTWHFFVLVYFFQAPENTVRYEIVGENDAPNYFFINPLDGVITLLRSVQNTQTSFYRVRNSFVQKKKKSGH